MKDYSNFINGFISKYEIVDDKILIYTPLTKKNEPQTKPLTKENLKKCEERLENQYRLIIENQDEIIKYNRNRKNTLLAASLGVSVATYFMLLIIFGANLLTGIALLTSLSIGLFGTLAVNESEKNFKKELAQYELYMKERRQIQHQAFNDENVLTYLSDDTREKVNESYKLCQQGMTDLTFNIDLMDKMSLKDLKKLLLRYKISQSLEEEQTFKVPSNNCSKTLKKTNKK